MARFFYDDSDVYDVGYYRERFPKHDLANGQFQCCKYFAITYGLLGSFASLFGWAGVQVMYVAFTLLNVFFALYGPMGDRVSKEYREFSRQLYVRLTKLVALSMAVTIFYGAGYASHLMLMRGVEFEGSPFVAGFIVAALFLIVVSWFLREIIHLIQSPRRWRAQWRDFAEDWRYDLGAAFALTILIGMFPLSLMFLSQGRRDD